MLKNVMLRLLAGSAVLALSSGLAAADGHEACDVNAENMTAAGTVRGEVKSIGWLVGARWGEGTLTLADGQVKRFNILGVKALETGVARTEFEGEVYNLKNVDDFPGTYYGAASGIALIHGEGEGVVNNARCVIVKLRANKEGLQVSGPAPGGVEISWDE